MDAMADDVQIDMEKMGDFTEEQVQSGNATAAQRRECAGRAAL